VLDFSTMVKLASSVLVVDDDAAQREFLCEGLASFGLGAVAVASADEALAWLSEYKTKVVVSDLRMPKVDGLALCKELVARYPNIPIILLTAFGSYEMAVAALRAGAYDFHAKPVDLEVLAACIQRAIERVELGQTVARLERELEQALPLRAASFGLVGESRAMQEVIALVARVAQSDASVCVTGESGTGKEVIARMLHDSSPRAAAPFVAVHCAALPEQLLEAELFGHEKGAYTDAKTARPGLFVAAGAGTIFLDEIGDMPLSLQVKLLRALQERKVRPIGAVREVPFEARVVSATHRDLARDVEEGKFREDLFFRIHVVPIFVPPLRARGHDILLLADHILAAIGRRSGRSKLTLRKDAVDCMLRYAWPGNVRELQNCMERAAALAGGDNLEAIDLPLGVRQAASSHAPEAPSIAEEFVTLEELERHYILRVLSAVGGNRSVAAKMLGLDRSTLWRKLDRLGFSKVEEPR
jgi:two-component system, NtrC family, response regulator AtoC